MLGCLTTHNSLLLIDVVYLARYIWTFGYKFKQLFDIRSTKMDDIGDNKVFQTYQFVGIVFSSTSKFYEILIPYEIINT